MLQLQFQLEFLALQRLNLLLIHRNRRDRVRSRDRRLPRFVQLMFQFRDFDSAFMQRAFQRLPTKPAVQHFDERAQTANLVLLLQIFDGVL